MRVGERLSRHDAVHARNLGWGELTNGELLTAAERAGFDVLLTADGNLAYQQNLTARRIALVVLPLNQLVVLLEHIGRIRAAVDRATPGSYQEVDIPRPTLKRRPWRRPGSA